MSALEVYPRSADARQIFYRQAHMGLKTQHQGGCSAKFSRSLNCSLTGSCPPVCSDLSLFLIEEEEEEEEEEKEKEEEEEEEEEDMLVRVTREEEEEEGRHGRRK